jgi:hypothetical protein
MASRDESVAIDVDSGTSRAKAVDSKHVSCSMPFRVLTVTGNVLDKDLHAGFGLG